MYVITLDGKDKDILEWISSLVRQEPQNFFQSKFKDPSKNQYFEDRIGCA